ncbi:hypothetical protein KFK09_016228 [Dendrobium nobile]|uniref:Uncharacterized protein n=1 Tax=Dendrobium nobile TaxID=94219 RepID=A0A8T3AZ00_DENNO|nr:hypothetical protein KFK09_016228 [Dendrobium nobile]
MSSLREMMQLGGIYKMWRYFAVKDLTEDERLRNRPMFGGEGLAWYQWRDQWRPNTEMEGVQGLLARTFLKPVEEEDFYDPSEAHPWVEGIDVSSWCLFKLLSTTLNYKGKYIMDTINVFCLMMPRSSYNYQEYLQCALDFRLCSLAIGFSDLLHGKDESYLRSQIDFTQLNTTRLVLSIGAIWLGCDKTGLQQRLDWMHSIF